MKVAVAASVRIANRCNGVHRRQQSQNSRSAVLIDGPGLLYPAYFGLEAYGDGEKQAHELFMERIRGYRDQLEPDYFAVAFDPPSADLWRRRTMPGYKLGRNETPAKLVDQFGTVEQQLDKEGFCHHKHFDHEADDVIASYSRVLREDQKCFVTIISSDKDFLQLVKDGAVTVQNPERRKALLDGTLHSIIEEADVEKKWGVRPDQMVDLLSLCGDKSDNVKGVPGIGPIFAAALLNELGNLESIFDAAKNDTGRILSIRGIGASRLTALQKNESAARQAKEVIELKGELKLPALKRLGR